MSQHLESTGGCEQNWGHEKFAKQETTSDDGNDSFSDDDDGIDPLELDAEYLKEDEKLRLEAKFWKTAVDPKSGRTYYYHTETRETQWRIPLCCASAEQRLSTIKKEKQTLAFFASMEKNILRTLQEQTEQRNQIFRASTDATPITKTTTVAASATNDVEENAISKTNDAQNMPPSQPVRLVRTISTMEDSVLASLIQRVPSYRKAAKNRDKANGILGIVSTFNPFSKQPTLKCGTNESQKDVMHQQMLSPIPETSDDKRYRPMASQTENFGPYTLEDDKKRMTSREDSLPFGAIMAASRDRRSGNDGVNDDISFNLSAMVRMNSHINEFQGSSDCNFILEETNEDNSESFCSHNGVLGLSRQSGFKNFARVGFHLANNDNTKDTTESDEPYVNLLLRQSLQRTTGNRELQVTPLAQNPTSLISRENSLNLSQISAGSQRRLTTTDKSLQQENLWESYLSDSAMQGLSFDESAAMVQLATITDQMASIGSSSPDSSINSLEDCSLLLENVAPSKHNTMEETVETINHIDTETDANITPNQTKENQKCSKSVASRPNLIRPTSTHTLLEKAMSAAKKTTIEKPSILRRNTCGTLYIGSTMSAPDKDATIKCVCAVYKAHIQQSILECNDDGEIIDDKHDVFNDCNTCKDYIDAPSLQEITLFYREVFTKSQMESDCIIISLIYVERLIKVTNGALRPCKKNWRSLLFSCMVLASKVWDDLSMWNADFSHTCPAGVNFNLARINELEIAVLSLLQYKVKIPASEYAKYYFLLRTMLIKSGLGSENSMSMNPLDVEGAKQLQHLSSQYQTIAAQTIERQKASLERAKTTGLYHQDSSSSDSPPLSPISEKQQRFKIGLEHMVKY